jgi:ribosome biogenesis GTPase
MKGKPKKSPREKDLTSRYLSGGLDEDRIDSSQRFTDRNKHAQANKTLKTAALRKEVGSATETEIETLPLGQVVQVYSLYCDVKADDATYLCTIRKTLNKVSDYAIVVGDFVRFRRSGRTSERGQPEGVVERVEPRKTVLTRADSFKQIVQHPVVANADQMLIVAAAANPKPKWGLIDRLLIAARSGGLEPILCLNKIDLEETTDETGIEDQDEAAPPDDDLLDVDDAVVVTPEPEAALAYYASIGVVTLRTSVPTRLGIDELSQHLRGRVTVLAGHSGVGKSSLIRAVQPSLDIRIGDVSTVTEKGRHTTTSARYYPLHGDAGGAVVDTPGVKVFGLWGVTRDNLPEHFPDVASNTAPPWRVESFQRIAESLKG